MIKKESHEIDRRTKMMTRKSKKETIVPKKNDVLRRITYQRKDVKIGM